MTLRNLSIKTGIFFIIIAAFIVIPVSAGGHWQIITVNNSSKDNRVHGDGYSTSLVIGSDGTPHISYFSPGWGAVRYATRAGGTWQLATIDGSRGTIRTSIALVPKTGYPAVTYSDSNLCIGDLKYAYWDGKMWNKEIVDTQVNSISCNRVGVENSLKFSENDLPVVAYAFPFPTGEIRIVSPRQNYYLEWFMYADLGDLVRGYHDPSLVFKPRAHSPIVAYRDGGPNGGNLALAEIRIGGDWEQPNEV